MGQRLVISIYDSESKEKIANCYYHWDGFIEKAVEYLQKINDAIDNLNKINSKIKEKKSWNNKEMRKLLAVQLLEKTTKLARLTATSLEQMKKLYPGICFKETEGSRNTGLIETTEKGMENCDNWADETLDIYIDFDKDEKEMYLKEYKLSSMPLLYDANKSIAHLFASALKGEWIEE